MNSAEWTGATTTRQRARVVQSVAPLALEGVDDLVAAIEEKRFNDPDVKEVIANLRNLHSAIGALLEAAEAGRPLDRALKAFNLDRERVLDSLKTTSKITMVAPALTIGLVHMLAFLGGVPVDSTLISAIFVFLLTADGLKQYAKRNKGSAS